VRLNGTLKDWSLQIQSALSPARATFKKLVREILPYFVLFSCAVLEQEPRPRHFRHPALLLDTGDRRRNLSVQVVTLMILKIYLPRMYVEKIDAFDSKY
jgi:hypothetical protein